MGIALVKPEEVSALMKKHFPKCPLCGKETEYGVTGLFKNYVQCRSCGGKWISNDFINCKELNELMLYESSKDGKGSSLLHENHDIAFWQNINAEQLREKEQIFAYCNKCGKPIPTGATYWYDKTKKILPDGKFCSELCFNEAYNGQMIKRGYLLFSKETTDEQLQAAIAKSQLEMTKFDDTYKTGQLAVFLKMDSAESMMVSMTRALLEEQRILILQNELILRELKRLGENSKKES